MAARNHHYASDTARPLRLTQEPMLRAACCGAAMVLLGACAAPAVAPVAPGATPAVPPIAAAPSAAPTTSTGRPVDSRPTGSSLPPLSVKRPSASAGTTVPDGPAENLGTPFATKYARFEPVPFTSLPGWTADSSRESLVAFKQSCLALGKKPVWSDLCTAAGRIDGANDAKIRQFFEDRFHAFSVLNPDQTDEGIITGYYEPLLEGSRSRSPRYPYPVIGVPADLLFLDAQTVAGGRTQWLSANDRRLVPVAPNTPGARQYEIAMGDMTPGIRDKRYRVRIDGNRVLPYWSRQQIERRVMDAQTLAWVNDPFALYSMQIQGSGKIRLPNGEMLRIAYAEQNGHPFLPQASSGDAVAVGSAIKTRGLKVGGASVAATSVAQGGSYGGGYAPSAPAMPSAPAKPQAGAARDPEVARLIAALQGPGASSAPRAAPAASAPTVPAAPALSSTARPASAANPEVAAIIAALSGKAPPPPVSATGTPAGMAPADGAGGTAADPGVSGGAGTRTGIPDPSYVFFRLIPDGPQGPLGALGVPLTAGRSIAVDPRTTPLGYPVFVSTGDAAQSAGGVNRLMFAQDTGGAIRGSVRADYFWGFGPNAGSRAASMKETGRMWLLLPRDLQVSAETLAVRTRSLGGARPLPECVVPDPDNCVDD